MFRLRLALVFVFVFVSGLTAQSCVDQVYVPGFSNGLEVTDRQSVVQTFTVGRDGHMTEVALLGLNHHRGLSPSTIEFAIVTTQNGVPTTNVLVARTLQPNDVPLQRGGPPVPVDIAAANLQVISGEIYGIWLRTNAPSGGLTYAWWGDAPGTYDRGEVYINTNVGPLGFDLGFRTHVDHSAARSNYGIGHPGLNGVPSLDTSANPVLGTTVQVLVGNSSGGGTFGLVLVGFSPASVATPFGGTILVAFAFTVHVAIPPPGVQIPLSIPADDALCGTKVYLQTVIADAAASVGIAFSRGLLLDLGH
jgi:hypothetical protein